MLEKGAEAGEKKKKAKDDQEQLKKNFLVMKEELK